MHILQDVGTHHRYTREENIKMFYLMCKKPTPILYIIWKARDSFFFLTSKYFSRASIYALWINGARAGNHYFLLSALGNNIMYSHTHWCTPMHNMYNICIIISLLCYTTRISRVQQQAITYIIIIIIWNRRAFVRRGAYTYICYLQRPTELIWRLLCGVYYNNNNNL